MTASIEMTNASPTITKATNTCGCTYSRPKSLGTYDHHRRPTSGMPTAAIAAHRPMISSLGER
jgi:hypothetical protein